MKTDKVHIDFKVMEKSFREYVRNKAVRFGSTIVYMENGEVIEEEPGTGKKTVLKQQLQTR